MLSRMTRTNMLAKSMFKSQLRAFSAQGVVTDELKDHLTRLNFTRHERIVHNPT